VTTTDDPENRKTVMELVKSACSERIYPVGRLDRSTTGVLLLTNDGDLASKLTHPKYEKRKIYQVWLDKPVSMEHMQAIADGIELEDGEIHADAISYVSEEDLSQVGIEIHSGKTGLFDAFSRSSVIMFSNSIALFAGLTKKNLARGKWRYLTEKEVNMLRMGISIKLLMPSPIVIVGLARYITRYETTKKDKDFGSFKAQHIRKRNKR